MKLYLASSFDLVSKVGIIADYLEQLGHVITVKWWSKDGFDMKDKKADQTSDAFYKDEVCKLIFERDKQGILDADALIIIADETPKKFNGANIEYGIAVGIGKPCFSIGMLENSAMYYPVVKCGSLDELVEALSTVVPVKEYISPNYSYCIWCEAKVERDEGDIFGVMCEKCTKKCHDFWDVHHLNTRFDDLPKITMTELVEKHREVLKLKELYEPCDVGTLLIGTYYGNAWHSRYMSGVIASLLDCGDYLTFYCSSSDYVEMMIPYRSKYEKLIQDFEKADAEDRRRRCEKCQ